MELLNIYAFKNFTELTKDEKLIVFNWRNHDSIRKWMFNSEPINFEEHKNFIHNLNTNKKKNYWLVIRKNIPVGVSSLVNIEKDKAEWGYYIAPNYHETSISIEFYYFTLSYLFDFLKFKIVYGYELRVNQNASSLNTLFGFTKQKTLKNIDNIEYEVNYRELSYEIWTQQVKNDVKVLRLLEYSFNRLNLL